MHWLVKSPWWQAHPGCYEYGEPPEMTGRCVVVEAPTRRDAIILGMRDVEMQDWVREARSHGEHPFAGVEAESMLCPHGACWGCAPEDRGACPECELEMEEEL